MHAASARAYQGRSTRPGSDRALLAQGAGSDATAASASPTSPATSSSPAARGDEVSIEAVKRTRGDRSELADVEIVVEERAGRVDVRAEHGRSAIQSRAAAATPPRSTSPSPIPATASLDVHSVSGSLKVTGVRGSVRAESVSGNVTTTDTPNLEHAKSVSGDVSLTGAAAEGDLTAGSVSGSITAKGLKARGLDLGSVSGDVLLTDVTCERLTDQVGQRRRRVHGHDRQERPLRDQFALRRPSA